MADLSDPTIQRAIRQAILAAAESLNTVVALLADEPFVSGDDDVQIYESPQELRRTAVSACKHKHRESLGGFGPSAGGWYCHDCGQRFEGEMPRG